MPKIPKISLDRSTAAVPGGSLPSPESFVAPLTSLNQIAETAFDISTTEGKRQAEEMRRALEAKQAIVNEVEAGRRVGDYEEELTDHAETIKKEFWDAPDKAPEALLNYGRSLQDQHRELVSNTEVGLDFAQRSNNRLSAMMREMHDWALSRQTQKAKGDLSTIINRATAGAENIGSVPVLGAYIAAKEKELSSVFESVLGSDAATKMADMRSSMTRAWVLSTANRPGQALGVLQALDVTKAGNPLVDNLDAAERASLRQRVKESWAGSYKTQVLEEVKKGTAQNRDLFDVVMNAPQEAGKTLVAAQSALEEQLKAAKAQMKVDTSVIQDWGIELHGRSTDEIPQLIEERLKYVKALDYARRTMIGFDAEDDPTATEGAILQVDKELTTKKGKDLGAILKQMTDLTVLYGNKKISQSTYNTLFRHMSLAVDVAAANNEDVWMGPLPNTWRLWAGPVKFGTIELNRQFAANAKIPKDMQNRTRIRYLEQVNAAQARGETLTTDYARRLALRSLALETGDADLGRAADRRK